MWSGQEDRWVRHITVRAFVFFHAAWNQCSCAVKKKFLLHKVQLFNVTDLVIQVWSSLHRVVSVLCCCTVCLPFSHTCTLCGPVSTVMCSTMVFTVYCTATYGGNDLTFLESSTFRFSKIRKLCFSCWFKHVWSPPADRSVDHQWVDGSWSTQTAAAGWARTWKRIAGERRHQSTSARLNAFLWKTKDFTPKWKHLCHQVAIFSLFRCSVSCSRCWAGPLCRCTWSRWVRLWVCFRLRIWRETAARRQTQKMIWFTVAEKLKQGYRCRGTAG